MIPIAEPILGEAEMANVVQAVKSTWISSKGEFIPLFEKQFAGYCGAKYGVAAFSFVTRDVPVNTVVAGVTANFVKMKKG